METQKEFKDLTNYEKLLQTAKSFSNSQGSYGRMYDSLLELESFEIDEINKHESLTNCKDMLDVVMLLEG